MDPDGRFWDTVWDICVTIFDFGKAIYKSCNGDNSGWIDVSLDAAALLLPCVPAGLSKVDDVVKFAKNGDVIADSIKFSKRYDVVYGASANGALKNLADSVNSVTLNYFDKPMEMNWIQFSKSKLDEIARKKGKVLFDLTNVSELDNVIKGIGQFSDNITSQELRYIKDNWDRFEDVVTFCKDGVEVAAPW